MSVPVPTISNYLFRVTPAAGKFIMELLAARPYGEVVALIHDLSQQAQAQEAAYADHLAGASVGETASDVSRETSDADEKSGSDDTYDVTRPPGGRIAETRPLIPPKDAPLAPVQRPNGPGTSLRAR